jgi:hypothetical protein
MILIWFFRVEEYFCYFIIIIFLIKLSLNYKQPDILYISENAVIISGYWLKPLSNRLGDL